jgi:hypothetical protein
MPVVDIYGNSVEFPDSLSPNDLNNAVAAAAKQMAPPPPQKGIVGKTLDALTVPEQMSRQGLTQLAGMVPNPEPRGNLPMDLVRGAPRIAADTMAEAAPGFISRASLLTAGGAKVLGAAKPVLGAIASGASRQLESASGIAPKNVGSLENTFKDPSIILAKGKEVAGKLYEAGKAEMPKAANIFKGMYKPEQIVDAAKEYMDKGGTLETPEALIYRKAISSLLKSGRYVKDELMSLKDEADSIVKASKNFSEADRLHARGATATAIRKIFPQNQGGGTSAFKSGVGLAMSAIPGGKVLAAGLLSPLVQGTGAAALGLAAKAGAGSVLTQPARAVTALQAALQYRKRRNGGM